MRVVLACLPTLGGSAITTVALAHGLARRGHDVAVVASRPPFACGPVPAEALQDGELERDGVLYVWPIESSHAVLDPAVLAPWRLTQLIGTTASRLGADIVNPHYLSGLLPAAVAAVDAFAPQAALVASAHGTDLTDVPAGTELLAAALLSRCAAVTTVSQFLATRLVDDLGVCPKRLRVIPNWVDAAPTPTNSIRAAPGAPERMLLVHVSNFRPVKRATRCADALAAVVAHRPARLVLVGDGPDKAAVLARADELGVGAHVHDAGVLAPSDAFGHVAAGDLLLLPSRSEQCSGALLQAMAAGVVGVAYSVGGNPEVVDNGRTGVLVPDEDDAAWFARAVAKLARNDDRRSAMADAARVAAAAYTEDATVSAYVEAYQSAAEARTTVRLRAS